MPIEVTTTLQRDVAVFLAGEDIHCKVSVRNTDSTRSESLAWCSVQVQCERLVDRGRQMADAPAGTAMTRSAASVFSCRPAVLFCDLMLSPREMRNFDCIQTLPSTGIPPSFKGHFIRYQYRLTVAVQHVNQPIRMVHLPLRILQAEFGLDQLCQPIVSTNPFLTDQPAKPTVIELAMSVVDTMTMHRAIGRYTMTSTRGRVAQLALFRRVFKLGDDIVGRFDFDGAEVSCIQYSVSLQSVESLDMEESRERVHSLASEHCVCAFHRDSHFRIHIPLTATPSFHTDTVHLRWRLHFEFVTSLDPIFAMPIPGLSKAPENCQIETTAWNIEVKLLPCSPYNIALTAVGLDPIAVLNVV